ncbi:MAG: FAD-binding oxidoreductase [Thermoleophilaceae bacterium]
MAQAAATRRLKHWGWGYEDQQPSEAELREAAAGIRAHLGYEPADVELPVPFEVLELPPPRIAPPDSLADICSSSAYERALRAYGKAYRDVVRAFRGRFERLPDMVAQPADEADVTAVLDWCTEIGAVAIPFGGGTSVVGGVEPPAGDRPVVTVDLRRLDRVLEVDPVSRAARIQAGALGPALEEQLRPHGLTLRHFPQSFEYSTLGGWIATRSGGHFATGPTHIDELVESVRALTPTGPWESRRLPGSGAGPSPDRVLIGSEGILGVITEAWVRVQARPQWKASAAVSFPTFDQGCEAVRALAQSGLMPSNCRLLEALEMRLTGAGDAHTLMLGFESADHPVDVWMARAMELCADHGGEAPDGVRTSGTGGGSGAWRDAFLRMPYVRDTMVAAGVVSDTFETSMTWDRMRDFIARVREVTEAAVREHCGAGTVTCRFTHAYPDGAAPYFTVLAPARRGAEIEQWDAIKAAASDAVDAAGGTITHHHAVGRDHRPWYDRQRPEPFAEALRAAKHAVDPAGILNPGVLIEPC